MTQCPCNLRSSMARLIVFPMRQISVCIAGDSLKNDTIWFLIGSWALCTMMTIEVLAN
ncbi:hypothetical protein BDV24DRAFT_128086, partial [Aspergillus arachidicola]